MTRALTAVAAGVLGYAGCVEDAALEVHHG